MLGVVTYGLGIALALHIVLCLIAVKPSSPSRVSQTLRTSEIYWHV